VSIDVEGSAFRMDAPVPAPAEDFAEWVRPHLPVLAALAAREVGAADADDVVQDALVRAWQRRSTYRPNRGSARAWLCGVLLDQARRRRLRHPRATRLAGEVGAAGSAPDDRLDLERAIRSLPGRQRQVITLHYLADLPLAEIAIALGISVGSVKSNLHDARSALRSRLEES
jgi:RNA polymerase sigma-70 factor (ECF subfamily)